LSFRCPRRLFVRLKLKDYIKSSSCRLSFPSTPWWVTSAAACWLLEPHILGVETALV